MPALALALALEPPAILASSRAYDPAYMQLRASCVDEHVSCFWGLVGAMKRCIVLESPLC
jgi:hypothetical protein